MIEIHKEIFLTKNEEKNLIILEWISSKKNDIIADHVSFFLS